MDIREEALKVRQQQQGILAVAPKVPLKNMKDLSILYTPGVAEPCKDIKVNKKLSLELTCRGNMVAIVTDGTRVLGLGDIGPEAALPVMEGKAVLFKVFGDVDAVPICLDTKDPDKIIEMVKLLQPTFAGINLEDISSPKCYEIEEALKKELDIPVFHDDQHGTAIAALAGVIGALRFTKKNIKTAKIVINGAGAAGTAIGRLLVKAEAQHVIMVDVNGALYEGMPGLNLIQQELAKETNKDKRQGSLAEIAKDADVLIGVSGPHLFTKEIMGSMAKDAIVFALANPVPETGYDAAKAAGVKVAGTGRSDSPNQVNNVMVFPGVFRGALDARACQINEEMKLAAAFAIAELIPIQELREDYIIPDPFDSRVAPAVAAAVAKAAMETGMAGIRVDPEELRRKTLARVKKFRDL
ncbi:NAD(P)-dependent malic enzyme [Sporomusa acidovorans]|uniref:NAD-dependent malic enzyme n=1 Tax=Sporomusa acidovorans (strain ATCC 49682 / DSM 3132 / Mol) TaxID=1123286 RepID=A0ABZ3J5Y3_SPOA4|nr:NADP-dependent malic enzyme [Sporomusa acidovorans]OZC21018.1 NAD-dependent malic enzyme [Sporomusa acidovorans DSM 3132]SDF18294.1 malate dehydrogenase (oxaloacetate-decarboxylating) [Sporomusa acidovorans]